MTRRQSESSDRGAAHANGVVVEDQTVRMRPNDLAQATAVLGEMRSAVDGANMVAAGRGNGDVLGVVIRGRHQPVELADLVRPIVVDWLRRRAAAKAQWLRDHGVAIDDAELT